MDKVIGTPAEAVADIGEGASILIGGFGLMQGWPLSLLLALRERGTCGLTVICNTPGVGPLSPQMLAEKHQIRKLITSFATYPTRSTPLAQQIREGSVELDLVPQGTLAERVRAAGAGIPAFYTPTGIGTPIAEGKECRTFGDRTYVLETELTADFAFIRATQADRYGNLVYRRGARNFNPIFATGARVTIAEVDEVVEPGTLNPEAVVTPGIYVDRVVKTEHRLDLEEVRHLSRRFGKVFATEPRVVREGPPGLPPDLMARRAARLLRDGEYVNLGLGLPTLISNFVTGERDITLHAENGILGYGPLVTEGEEDIDLYNASGQLVRLLAGASFFHSADAFAMARGGRVSTVVLGAFQVSEKGDLANWNVPHLAVGGIGGAMDLAAAGARVIVVMYHTTRDGAAKLVRRCTYPLTAAGRVTTVVTDLALIEIDREGFLLKELAPGISVEDVRRATDANLRLARHLKEMEFD